MQLLEFAIDLRIARRTGNLNLVVCIGQGQCITLSKHEEYIYNRRSSPPILFKFRIPVQVFGSSNAQSFPRPQKPATPFCFSHPRHSPIVLQNLISHRHCPTLATRGLCDAAPDGRTCLSCRCCRARQRPGRPCRRARTARTACRARRRRSWCRQRPGRGPW